MLNTCDKTKMTFFGIQIPFAYIFIMTRRQILFLTRLLKIDSQAVLDMINGMDTRLTPEERIKEILIGYMAAKKAKVIVENMVLLPEVKLECMNFMDQEKNRIAMVKRSYKDELDYQFAKHLRTVMLRIGPKKKGK